MLPVSDALFHAVVESIHEGLIITDLEDRVTYINPCLTRMLGYKLEDFGDSPPFHLFAPPAKWQEMEQHYLDCLKNIETNFEIQLMRKDGSALWVRINGSPLQEGENVVGTLSLVADISGQKAHEKSLQQFSDILEATSDFVAIADKYGCATYINRAGRHVLGVTAEEYKGRPIGTWHPEWARHKIVEEGIAIAAREGVWVGETAIIDSKGRQVPMSQLILIHKDEGGAINFISTIARDISDRKATEKQIEAQRKRLEEQKSELEEANVQLRELATVDGLTGLKNQRAFYDRLNDVSQYSIRYYVSHSLLLIDVDQFKEYNDTYGHLAGDEVLKQVALILLEQTRETDFVARYGGEEFAVILPLANREESRLTAERIRRAVATFPWPLSNVTISLGVATAIGNEFDLRDFVFAADQALYESKRRGRNRVTCAGDMKISSQQGHILTALAPDPDSLAPNSQGDEKPLS